MCATKKQYPQIFCFKYCYSFLCLVLHSSAFFSSPTSHPKKSPSPLGEFHSFNTNHSSSLLASFSFSFLFSIRKVSLRSSIFIWLLFCYLYINHTAIEELLFLFFFFLNFHLYFTYYKKSNNRKEKKCSLARLFMRRIHS